MTSFFFYVCMHDSAMRPMYFANGSRGGENSYLVARFSIKNIIPSR